MADLLADGEAEVVKERRELPVESVQRGAVGGLELERLARRENGERRRAAALVSQ